MEQGAAPLFSFSFRYSLVYNVYNNNNSSFNTIAASEQEKQMEEQIYTLKHFDTPLLDFSIIENTSRPAVRINWHNREAMQLLPLDLGREQDSSPDEKGLSLWLRRRTIPSNRAYVQNFLSKCGLSMNRPMDIIRISKGLSLNDCYWVTEKEFDGSFAQYNLYDNRFSRVLGLIAFTGHGSSVRSTFHSSPEFTTTGMLPKCWRRIGGTVQLFKGGTSGASNTGCEPYAEFYAYQIAQALGIHAVPYGLSRWKGQLCSTCALFTDKEHSYLPAGRLVTAGGMNAVLSFYKALGPQYTEALAEMFVLDALIYNTDRHFGNFGLIIDSRSNQICAAAPLFDHGNSLFNFAGREDLISEETLISYADTLLPSVYDDYTEMARQHMTAKLRKSLHSMTEFSFKKHSRYNLPQKRLNLMEKLVRQRVRELLK